MKLQTGVNLAANIGALDAQRDARAADVGFKAANLELMRAVAQATNAPWTTPETFPLSHVTMLDLVGSQGAQAVNMWRAFVEQLGDRTVLSHADVSQLDDIAAHLDAALVNAEGKLGAILEPWLTTLRDPTLIVRSTGLEDSKACANAGGNESVPKVAPNAAAILNATRVVVRSYVSAHSISQQLRSGSRLSTTPFWPVLTQVMAGVDRPGGAAFYPERNAYTAGVAQVQAARDNESVVNGLGDVDTYYVGAGRTHAVIHPKAAMPSVPGAATALGVVSLKPVIDAHVAEQVAQAAHDLAPFYAPSVDLEYVDSTPLTLVQARPPKHGAALTVQPSYVVPPAKAQVRAGQVIVSIGGAATLAQGSASVIVAPDIATAHAKYLALESDAAVKAVRCVLLRTPSNSTSHWANEFGTDGISVFHFGARLDEVSKWLNDGAAVAFDSQTGVAVRLPADVSPTWEALREHGIIRDGMRRHPIPARQSIARGDRLDADLADVCARLRERHADARHEPAEDPTAAGWEAPRNRLHAALLRVEAATDDAGEASAVMALLQLAGELRAQLPAGLHARLGDVLGQLCRDASDLLEDRAEGGATVATQGIWEARRRAFHLVWLRAGVMQPADPHVVDGASLWTLVDDAKALMGMTSAADANTLTALSRMEPDALAAYAHVHDLALSPGTAALWRDFVAANAAGDYARGPAQMLARLVHAVSALSMAPVWLNTEFARVFERAKSRFPNNVNKAANVALLQLDARLHAPRVQEAIAWGQAVDAWTRTWTSHPDFASADPVRIARAWAQLEAEARTHLFSPDAVKTFTAAGPLGRAAMLAVRRRGIDVCDLNVKTMMSQGCPKAPLERAKLLHTMLTPLLDVRDAWAQVLPSLSGRTALDEQLKALRDIHGALLPNSEEQARELLHISAMFDVAGAQLGAGTNFSRHAPKTLHEVFTVVHQDLLMEGVILQRDVGLRVDVAPEPTRRLGRAILGAQLWSLEAQRFVTRAPEELGFEYEGNSVRNVFHAPQRNHSAKFMLETDVGRQGNVRGLRLQVELYGWQNPKQPRMNRAATYGELFAHGCGLTFAPGLEPRYERDVMRFCVDIPLDRIDAVEAALPEYLKLMTGILYTASVNLEAPLPESPYEFSDKATYDELCRNAQVAQPGFEAPPFERLTTRALWNAG